MALTFRKVIGIALGATAAAMGGLIAAPTLHDRLWMGHAMFSEFPWVTSFIGSAGMITNLARNPRSPWGALLSATGVGLSLLPMLQARTAMEDMDKAMLAGLGKNYEKQITPAMLKRVSPHRWTANNTLKWQYEYPAVNVTRDLVYSQPGLRPLKMDIYQPTAPPAYGTQYPAVIAVHGGGWRSYDKGGVFVPHHMHLAAQGYVVFDIQYRFSGEAIYPAQLQDVQCAIRWVRAHAKEYNLDSKRIALLGRSSGGHISLLAAYRANDPNIGKTGYDDEDSSVSAVVTLYPPTDLRLWQSIPGGALYELLGGQTNEIPKLYTEASVTSWVRDNLPPTMIVQGYMDELVQPIHAELLHNLLRGTNTPSVLLRIPWGRHVFDAVMSGLGAQLAQYHIDRFLAWNLYRDVHVTEDTVFPGVPYE